MIAKGNQRSGGFQLATHLLNAHDNERVEVAEVRGSIADDLHGAFAEWHAQSKATNCTKYLYSLSVNPDQKQGHLTREQYLDFLERVEKRLGLESQGRVVVFHWKKDRDGEAREHCHAVWSRIDAHASRAVNIAHDRMKLRNVAQEFALAHERRLPRGMREDHGPARHDERAGHANLQEKQQEERSGISKEERRAILTQVWQRSTDGPSLAQGLKDAGYVLACGDSRAYVVVDRAGEVHALSRQVDGVKAAAVKARLAASHPPERLPAVEEARAAMAAQREKLRPLQRQQPTGPTPDERRAQLAARQQARRQQLAEQRTAMTERHAAERQDLESLRQTIPFNRAASRGISLLIRHIASRYQRHQQTRTLDRRQKSERNELSRQERSLESLDAREQRSLRIRIGRDAFQLLAKEIKSRDAVLEKPGAPRAEARHPDARLPDRTAIPSMTQAERQSRLKAAFRPDMTSSLPRPARDEGAQLEGPLRSQFGGATIPWPAMAEQSAEAERERELERQRQLEALRHDR